MGEIAMSDLAKIAFRHNRYLRKHGIGKPRRRSQAIAHAALDRECHSGINASIYAFTIARAGKPIPLPWHSVIVKSADHKQHGKKWDFRHYRNALACFATIERGERYSYRFGESL